MEVIKKVPLTAHELLVLQTMAENDGEYLWQQGKPNYVSKPVLKELIWKRFIKRKEGFGNVFVIEFWGSEVLKHNKLADEFNNSYKIAKHGKK